MNRFAKSILLLLAIAFIFAGGVMAGLDINKPEPECNPQCEPYLSGPSFGAKVPCGANGCDDERAMLFSNNDVLLAGPLDGTPLFPEVKVPHELDRPADVLCVALVVFTEARGESALGQGLVASTAWNRAEMTGKDACDVVEASDQYALTLSADPWIIDEAAWMRSVRIAMDVRSGDFDTAACQGATHFHNASVSPAWAKRMTPACEVDGHKFYR